MRTPALKTVSAVTVVALLGGCSSHVALKNPTIPDPLIDQMPLSVAARYPEAFDHYVHEEQVIGKKKWTIDLGEANSILFNKLFSAMFTDFAVLEEGADPNGMTIDALIEPSIDAFEFSVPNQSQTDAFAVWIRYRIKIFDSEGNQIANWPISAYGKSMAEGFGKDDALRRAAVLAMRDAAALVIMQMDKATGISALSAARSDVPSGPAPSDGARAGQRMNSSISEQLHDDTG